MTMLSKDYVTLWVVATYLEPPPSNVWKVGWKRTYNLSVCHATSCNHVIKGSHELVINYSLSKTSIISWLFAIGFVEKEIKHFHLSWELLLPYNQCHLILWVTTLSSLLAMYIVDVDVFCFSFVTWPCVIKWSKDHATFLIVAPCLKPPSCQIGWLWALQMWRYIAFCLSRDIMWSCDQRVMQLFV